MKKLICMLLVMCLLPVVGLCDVDLSSMSYDELVTLSQQITVEIMSRPEWKEVSVPTGTWEIGTDIPAGMYSIRTTSKKATIWYTKKSGIRDYIYVYPEEPLGKIELLEGTTLEINTEVIISPPLSLGF